MKAIAKHPIATTCLIGLLMLTVGLVMLCDTLAQGLAIVGTCILLVGVICGLATCDRGD